MLIDLKALLAKKNPAVKAKWEDLLCDIDVALDKAAEHGELSPRWSLRHWFSKLLRSLDSPMANLPPKIIGFRPHPCAPLRRTF